jgi:hypothetical protein
MRIGTAARFGALLAAATVAQQAFASSYVNGYFALVLDGFDCGLLAIDG